MRFARPLALLQRIRVIYYVRVPACRLLLLGWKGASGLCGGERRRGISVAGWVEGRLYTFLAVFVCSSAGLSWLQARDFGAAVMWRSQTFAWQQALPLRVRAVCLCGWVIRRSACAGSLSRSPRPATQRVRLVFSPGRWKPSLGVAFSSRWA